MSNQRQGVLVRDGASGHSGADQRDVERRTSPPPIPPMHRTQSVDRSAGSSISQKQPALRPSFLQSHQNEQTDTCEYCGREFLSRVLFDHKNICEKKR